MALLPPLPYLVPLLPFLVFLLNAPQSVFSSPFSTLLPSSRTQFLPAISDASTHSPSQTPHSFPEFILVGVDRTTTKHIHGLTTAASLWLSAAVGVAAGG